MKYALGIGGVMLGGIVVIALILLMTFWGLYNSIVTQNQNVETAKAEMQVEYQRRFDLVPDLVAAVKGTLRQEQAVFGAIAEARTRYASAPAGSDEQVQATGQYESALARLLVVMENYPVLQSNATVQNLMASIEGTENRVQNVRTRYNEQVRIYNLGIVTFPKNILAGFMGFKPHVYYEADQGAEKSPEVDLTV